MLKNAPHLQKKVTLTKVTPQESSRACIVL